MAEKSFEELLFEGVMTALRSQALEDLYEYRDSLDEMDLPAEYLEFPTHGADPGDCREAEPAGVELKRVTRSRINRLEERAEEKRVEIEALSSRIYDLKREIDLLEDLIEECENWDPFNG